ncbi:MAG: MlaD family protein [Solirubrobacteraceae bacterium]|nr:MlaD family protein [Solirubrobacteraceae bacterium]
MILPLLAVVAVVAVLALRDGGDDGHRVDVVFDSARGLQEGSLVKVAGARVGRITAITLTDDRHARVSLLVDGDVGAFRRDAECGVRPEGLIAENFVDCDPGTPGAGPLAEGPDGVPTVPVDGTTRPVNLADLLNLWSVPTGERARVLVSQLGLGLSASGDDLNRILRRTNPAMREADRLLAILDRQRSRLRSTVERTQRVMAVLSDRRGSLHRLTTTGRAVTRRVARRAPELEATLRRMPALLDAAAPALRELDVLSDRAEPLLAAGDRAAPGLVRLGRRAGPVIRTADRTLRRITGPLREVRTGMRDLAPLLPVADRGLRNATPTVTESDRTLVALRDAGFFEGLWSFLYYAGSALSRYDVNGHLFGGHILLNRCMIFAHQPVEGCSAWQRDEAAAGTPTRPGPAAAARGGAR